MERKTAKRAAFTPQTMGAFVLLLIILSFTAGIIRREMVLTLTGATLLAVWAYCLVMTLLLALFHCRRAGRVSIRLSPEKITIGGSTEIIYMEGLENTVNQKIFQLPGILVRCRVLLNTVDKRRVVYDFKPAFRSGIEQQETFTVNKRGAYFSGYDEFAVFDILGFFRFAFRIPAESGARLLVSPNAAAEPVPVMARGGETSRQEIPPTERSDYLIDHRPYVPGDDPRRVNWKLYSHGGELFVRQGEHEPPPQSNLIILIDTQYDSSMGGGFFGVKRAAKAVDLLCENALAIINNAGKEKDIQIGFTNMSAKSGNSLTQAELGFFLAYPAALPVAMAADLPPVPDDRWILIFALPRIWAGDTALERFLSRNANRLIELIFIYDINERGIEQAAAAETCAAIYNRRSGIRARAVGVY